MSVNLEQVDLLRKRASVGYEEAKAALEQSNGDLVEALIILEKEKKLKRHDSGEGGSTFDKGVHTVKGLVQKGNASRLVIARKDAQLLNLSLTTAVIGTVIAPHLALVGLPLALLTNHKVKIVKADGGEAEINQVLNQVSEKVHSFTQDEEK